MGLIRILNYYIILCGICQHIFYISKLSTNQARPTSPPPATAPAAKKASLPQRRRPEEKQCSATMRLASLIISVRLISAASALTIKYAVSKTLPPVPLSTTILREHPLIAIFSPFYGILCIQLSLPFLSCAKHRYEKRPSLPHIYILCQFAQFFANILRAKSAIAQN